MFEFPTEFKIEIHSDINNYESEIVILNYIYTNLTNALD